VSYAEDEKAPLPSRLLLLGEGGGGPVEVDLVAAALSAEHEEVAGAEGKKGEWEQRQDPDQMAVLQPVEGRMDARSADTAAAEEVEAEMIAAAAAEVAVAAAEEEEVHRTVSVLSLLRLLVRPSRDDSSSCLFRELSSAVAAVVEAADESERLCRGPSLPSSPAVLLFLLLASSMVVHRLVSQQDAATGPRGEDFP
jgi:hypothetical protein